MGDEKNFVLLLVSNFVLIIFPSDNLRSYKMLPPPTIMRCRVRCLLTNGADSGEHQTGYVTSTYFTDRKHFDEVWKNDNLQSPFNPRCQGHSSWIRFQIYILRNGYVAIFINYFCISHCLVFLCDSQKELFVQAHTSGVSLIFN